MSIYVHAELDRAGLANRLFPWARAEIYRKYQNDIVMLAPNWTQIKIGTFIRHEKDLRLYMGLFNNDGYLTGVPKMLSLMTRKRVSEEEAISLTESERHGLLDGKLVLFSGMKNLTHDLMGHHDFLHQRLVDMLQPKLRRMLHETTVDYEIAVHARRSDVPVFQMGEHIQKRQHYGAPDQWYIKLIEQIREAVGREVSVRVFSDAYPEQIKDLLSVPGVSKAEDAPSIVDILRLARAKVLLASPTSTFSTWASFLGQVLSVWHPDLYKFPCMKTDNQVCGEILPDYHGNLSQEQLQRLACTIG